MIRDCKLDITTWKKQKELYRHPDHVDTLQLGFAFFFLNRTNRSGILNGGVIGGIQQKGKWLIDARFKKLISFSGSRTLRRFDCASS